MIVRENKQVIDDTKRKKRKLRAFDELVDYMDGQYQHRAILFDPRGAKRESGLSTSNAAHRHRAGRARREVQISPRKVLPDHPGHGPHGIRSRFSPKRFLRRTFARKHVKMARGRSLRSVANELGYAPSTLSKHLRNKVFRELPQGGFDIEHVRRGLLTGTSPNQTHSVKLAAKLPKSEHSAPNARTPVPGISARYIAPTIGYDDDDEEPVELPPEQEAGVQAAMKHLRDDKVRLAINVLCGLPTNMAADMTKHDREVNLQAATNYFENLIVDNLRYAFTLPRRKDNAR